MNRASHTTKASAWRRRFGVVEFLSRFGTSCPAKRFANNCYPANPQWRKDFNRDRVALAQLGYRILTSQEASVWTDYVGQGRTFNWVRLDPHLKQIHDQPIWKAFQLAHALIQSSKWLINQGAVGYFSPIYFLHSQGINVDNPSMQKLVKQIEIIFGVSKNENPHLYLQYRNASQSTTRWRLVKPIGLFCWQGLWYLDAHEYCAPNSDENTDKTKAKSDLKTRRFSLHRMEFLSPAAFDSLSLVMQDMFEDNGRDKHNLSSDWLVDPHKMLANVIGELDEICASNDGKTKLQENKKNSQYENNLETAKIANSENLLAQKLANLLIYLSICAKEGNNSIETSPTLSELAKRFGFIGHIGRLHSLLQSLGTSTHALGGQEFGTNLWVDFIPPPDDPNLKKRTSIGRSRVILRSDLNDVHDLKIAKIFSLSPAHAAGLILALVALAQAPAIYGVVNKNIDPQMALKILGEIFSLKISWQNSEIFENYMFSKNLAKTLNTALAKEQSLEIEYVTAINEKKNRKIKPLWIFTQGQFSYLQAWCYLHKQEKTFRVDRILSAHLQETEDSAPRITAKQKQKILQTTLTTSKSSKSLENYWYFILDPQNINNDPQNGSLLTKLELAGAQIFTAAYLKANNAKTEKINLLPDKFLYGRLKYFDFRWLEILELKVKPVIVASIHIQGVKESDEKN